MTPLDHAVRIEAEAHRRFLASPECADAHAAWAASRRELRRVAAADKSARVLADPPETGLVMGVLLGFVFLVLGVLVTVAKGWA